MLRVLSKEEAFCLLNRKFEVLKEKVVIDVCYEDIRLPAIVLSIDKNKRSFTILPLDKEGIETMLSGGLPEPVTISLPSSPDVEHPCWNEVGK